MIVSDKGWGRRGSITVTIENSQNECCENTLASGISEEGRLSVLTVNKNDKK